MCIYSAPTTSVGKTVLILILELTNRSMPTKTINTRPMRVFFKSDFIFNDVFKKANCFQILSN